MFKCDVACSRAIIVTTEFEGLHCYPDAPAEVQFLASPHRHIFKVKAKIQVFHDNRELEFFKVKRDISWFINGTINKDDCGSCEKMAEDLANYLAGRYNINNNINARHIEVEVWEDGENGSIFTLTPLVPVEQLEIK